MWVEIHEQKGILCNFHIRTLWQILCLLTLVANNTVTCSVVHLRLDHCNYLLRGASETSSDRLQWVQTGTCCSQCRHPSAPLYRPSLRITLADNPQMSDFQDMHSVHNALQHQEPIYLHDALHRRVVRTLRSSDQGLLEVSRPKTKIFLTLAAFYYLRHT